MVHEHRLHVVVRGSVDLAVVEPDCVRLPLHEAVAREERCVAGDFNHVSVPLDACHVGGFRYGGVERVPPSVHPRCVLAYEDLRLSFSARVEFLVVVAAAVREEPCVRVVVVLVHQIGEGVRLLFLLPRLHLLPCVVEVHVVVGEAGGDDCLDVRILLLDCRRDELEAGEVVPSAVLVSDSDVVELERLRVSGLRSDFSPFARGGSRRPLNHVERVLRVPFVVACRRFLAVVAHSHAQDRNRLGVQVLAEPEILVESDSVRLLVGNESSPEVRGLLPLLDRPHRVLPLVAVRQEVSVYDAAAGEADECRVHGFEHLRQILSESVRLVLVDVRHEERDEIHVDFARLV